MGLHRRSAEQTRAPDRAARAADPFARQRLGGCASSTRQLDRARPGLRGAVEVNLAGEPGKAGIAPAELDAFIERVPLPVSGLMTMPPRCADPEQSRPWFALLRELADARGLRRLSMGTTQDFAVAVAEGATIVRIGTRLYA